MCSSTGVRSLKILLPKSPKEAPQQKRRNLGYILTIPYLRLLFAIAGRDGHINNPAAGDVQLH